MAPRERGIRRTSGAGRIADAALTLASIGGVICIAAVIAATFFDITLIMFKTGSMSPTIPAGSLAVVRQIDAGEAEVGDVLTIDRPGALPITHRVTSTTEAGGGLTSITMRGDANAVEDPQPYVVGEARVVLFSVPGLASAVIAVSNPYAMGSITIGTALLVGWAFWPRGAGGAGGSRGAGSTGSSRGAGSTGSRHRASHARHGRGRRAATGATMVAVLCACAPLALPAQQARADEVETVVRGEYLTLRSIADPEAMQGMTPGRPVAWQVGVTVQAPEPGTVHVGISAEGGLVDPGALELQIRGCATRWVAGDCTTGHSVWLPLQDIMVAAAPMAGMGVRELDTVESDETTWLMIDVVMPTEAPPGSTAVLNIHAWGESTDAAAGRFDAVQVGGTASSRLAPTGVAVGTAVWLAFGAVGFGLLLAATARIVRHRRSTSPGAPPGARS